MSSEANNQLRSNFTLFLIAVLVAAVAADIFMRWPGGERLPEKSTTKESMAVAPVTAPPKKIDDRLPLSNKEKDAVGQVAIPHRPKQIYDRVPQTP